MVVAAERALEAVNEERVVGLLCRLIDTPSSTGNERACAEVLARHLSDHGVQAQTQLFQDTRANVLASVAGRGDGVRLMFCGHLDTSGTGDPDRDFAGMGAIGPADLPHAFIQDGIVYGLGAYNMKGGVAAAAEALVALKEAGASLAGDVLLGAVAGESEKAPVRGALHDFSGASYEGGGVGAQWLLQHSARPDAVVIGEPCDCWVVNGQPGYFFLKLSFFGRALYEGARGPQFQDESSIDLACRVVQALKAWEPEYRERYRLECGMGTMYPNVTVGGIEGGWLYKPSNWPRVCNVYVDLRVPPHLDSQDALRELDGVVRSALGSLAEDRYALEVFGSNLPGAVTPVDHPLVQAALSARNAVLGEPQVRHPDIALASGDDGKLFASFGIPYVKCGPSNSVTAGQRPLDTRLGKEWVEIRQLVQAARIYVLLALDMANRGRAEIARWPMVKVSPRGFA